MWKKAWKSEVGQLCTLEAMKMEMAVYATEAGVLRHILCRPNQQVAIGQPLFEIEAEEGGQSQSQQQRFSFPPLRPLIKLLQNGRPDPTFDRIGEAERKEILDDPKSVGFTRDVGL